MTDTAQQRLAFLGLGEWAQRWRARQWRRNIRRRYGTAAAQIDAGFGKHGLARMIESVRA